MRNADEVLLGNGVSLMWFPFTLSSRDVLPSVEPGYLHDLLPGQLQDAPEDWKTIMEDFKQCILPGLTHWQSPHFHAFYPSQTSYSSIVGETLAAGLGVVGFSWVSWKRASRPEKHVY